MIFICSASVSKDGHAMMLEKTRKDSGFCGSMVWRAYYKKSISIETEITTTGATGSVLPCTIMPPEVLESRENVTFSTDVWSFGVLLWEMFTGGEDVNKHLRHLHAQTPISSPFFSG